MTSHTTQKQDLFFPQKAFISFDLVDAAGIVFFAHLFTLSHHLFETAIVPFFGMSWKEWFNNGQWIAPIKHCEATYQKPLVGGQAYDVLASIRHVGESSFSIDYRFSLNQEEYCLVTIVQVFCDRSSGKKIPIPTMIRKQLEHQFFTKETQRLGE
jgi:acyl-CoA thioesterase FadM